MTANTPLPSTFDLSLLLRAAPKHPLHICCAHPRVLGPSVGFQARLESSGRRKSSDDVIADSPYAAGGGSSSSNTTTTTTITSKNSQAANHSNGNDNGNGTGSGNAAWKHKHTKTLPWGEDGVAGVDGGGDGGSGGCTPDADAGRQEGRGLGREPAVDRLAEKRTDGGRGGRAREGYRLQVCMYVCCFAVCR